MTATRADICTVAVAECFRGDGEIVANPIGTIPRIGGLLGPPVWQAASPKSMAMPAARRGLVAVVI